MAQNFTLIKICQVSSPNSPFEYNPEFIKDKVLVLTTTNGTKLLHMALDKSAREIVTGSFPNLSAVCEHLLQKREDVILACAGWKDRVNIEDSLFAGAVINRLKDSFDIEGDSSHVAHNLYILAQKSLYEFMKKHNASHYHRLTNFGLEKDIRYCLSTDVANVLPVYIEGKLVTA
ncbi:MAG: 2-phosphosulfolactate phosphatase [Chitinophagaceae bacterium]|nr:2-phosphosulfolactate phosphatase [Chitinophagaceae bacterium]